MRTSEATLEKWNLRLVASNPEMNRKPTPKTALKERWEAWRDAAEARGISLEQARQEGREDLDEMWWLHNDPGFQASLDDFNFHAAECGLTLRQAVNERKIAHSLAGCPWPE